MNSEKIKHLPKLEILANVRMAEVGGGSSILHARIVRPVEEVVEIAEITSEQNMIHLVFENRRNGFLGNGNRIGLARRSVVYSYGVTSSCEVGEELLVYSEMMPEKGDRSRVAIFSPVSQIKNYRVLEKYECR